MSDDNKSAADELKQLVAQVLIPQVSELREKMDIFSTGVSGLVTEIDTVHKILKESLRREIRLTERLDVVESRLEGIGE